MHYRETRDRFAKKKHLRSRSDLKHGKHYGCQDASELKFVSGLKIFLETGPCLRSQPGK